MGLDARFGWSVVPVWLQWVGGAGVVVSKGVAYWFHNRLVKWSKSQPRGRATMHVFRKTGLQYARTGEDVNRQVAADAHVGEGVMMAHYVEESDLHLRQASNRTFRRILASLPAKVAERYGNSDQPQSDVEERIREAVAALGGGRATFGRVEPGATDGEELKSRPR